MRQSLALSHRPWGVLLSLLAALLFMCAGSNAAAQGSAAPANAPNTPTGLWRTIDDNTGKPSGLVRITEVNGEYIGKVEKISPGVTDQAVPTCDDCAGALKGQPVLGMTILWGVHRGREPNNDEYGGGEILDPQNGRVYHALLTMADGGRKLRVRGYLLVTLFGRTQVWEREE